MVRWPRGDHPVTLPPTARAGPDATAVTSQALRCDPHNSRLRNSPAKALPRRRPAAAVTAYPSGIDDLRRVLHDREVPQAALAIFHALTSGQLRKLKTADLRDGRLFLPSRTVLLADAVRTRLAAYLNYRNRRWPAPPTRTCSSPRRRAAAWSRSATSGSTTFSACPSAGSGTGSGRTASSTKPRPPIRQPRRICDVFGLSIGAALRYTGTNDQPGLIEHSLRNAGPTRR